MKIRKNRKIGRGTGTTGKEVFSSRKFLTFTISYAIFRKYLQKKFVSDGLLQAPGSCRKAMSIFLRVKK